LNLKSGFWQIKDKEADKYKRAFVCYEGLYEWNVMSFGLTNVPSKFQDFVH